MSILFLVSCIYFFLPAYFANMTPPLLAQTNLFKKLDGPVDFGYGSNFFKDKQPFLGSHKTWRGVIFGVVSGLFFVFIQYYLYQFPIFQKISFINYSQINILLLGLLMSSGAIFGDLLFAFIKRRLNLRPGAMFMPFDQTNYVIGACIFLNSFLGFSLYTWGVIFILTFFLHLIFNRIAYLLKIHPNKW